MVPANLGDAQVGGAPDNLDMALPGCRPPCGSACSCVVAQCLLGAPMSSRTYSLAAAPCSRSVGPGAGWNKRAAAPNQAQGSDGETPRSLLAHLHQVTAVGLFVTPMLSGQGRDIQKAEHSSAMNMLAVDAKPGTQVMHQHKRQKQLHMQLTPGQSPESQSGQGRSQGLLCI